jgi:hypothetical protein
MDDFLIPYYMFYEPHLPKDFDFEIYTSLYKLDSDCNKNFIINHYFEKKLQNNHHIHRFPENFDINIYKLYDDLKNMNENELLEHYILFGIQENRIINLPNDFDFLFYKKLYIKYDFENDIDIIKHYVNNTNKIYNVPIDFELETYKRYKDLEFMNDDEIKIHYLRHGQSENRCKLIPKDFDIQKFKNMYPETKNFSVDEIYDFYVNNNLKYYKYPDNLDIVKYKKYNYDLQHLDDNQLYIHFMNNGQYEGRLYYDTPMKDFDPVTYSKLNIILLNQDSNFLINHFLTHGIYENRLYYFPENINQEFIKKFYYMKSIDSYLNKYVGTPYIVTYEFSLMNFNYYFIYEYYNLENLFDYSLNKIYDYINQNIQKIEFYNSRTLINSLPKSRKKFILIYAVHIDEKNNIFLKDNLDLILKSKYLFEIYFVYSKSDSIEFDLNEKYQNINFINVHNVAYDSFKYITGYLAFKKFYLNPENFYFILLNNSVNLINTLDDINEYYYSILNEFISYTDSYEPCYFQHKKNIYHLQSYFFVMSYKVIELYFEYLKIHLSEILHKQIETRDSIKDYIIQNIEVNIHKYFREKNIIGISYMSVDDYLPLFHLSLFKLNLTNSNHLLFRNSSKYPTFIKYLFNDYFHTYVPYNIFDKVSYLKNIHNKKYFEENHTNEISKKIAFCIHIANEKMIDDYLIDINLVLSHTKCNFYIYITLTENLLKYQKKIIGFLKNNNSLNKIKILVVKNKGADLGPFLRIISKFLLNEKFDYVIKYHSKTDTLWRKDLQYPFSFLLYPSLVILDNNKTIGGISSGNFLFKLDYTDKTNFRNILIRNSINIENINNWYFVGGTIFMIKYQVLINFIKKIDIEYEYKILEETVYINDELSNDVSTVHCWERIISGLIYNEDNKIFGM